MKIERVISCKIHAPLNLKNINAFMNNYSQELKAAEWKYPQEIILTLYSFSTTVGRS